MLELKNICYTVSTPETGEQTILKDISVTIPDGKLIVNDHQRSRLTGGLTLSLKRPFVSDIRLNYEKYFYRNDGVAKPSEKDKIVVEIMTRF
mgnify:CR=1 FL=1